MKFVIPLSVALALGGVGCGSDYSSPQEEWSQITPEQRAEIRRTVQYIMGGGARPIRALAVAGVINDEGQRVFADPNADSIVVTERQLDLTSSEVLPELDENGAWDPTGGYREFTEEAFDDQGEQIRDEKVRRPIRQFTAGSLSSFDYLVTTDTPVDLYEVNTGRSAFEVGNETTYVTTIWNQVTSSQRIDNGPAHGQVFTYLAQPTLNVVLRQGGKLENSELAEDTILSEQGFDTNAKAKLDVDLSGTYTLYRPVAVEANTRAEAALATNTNTVNNITTTQSSVTTKDEDESTVGALNEKKVTTASTLTNRVTDDANGARQLSSETVVHTTVVYTYEVENSTAPDLDQQKELHPNHVVTTRVTTRITNTYDENGSFTTTTVITSEKYTDNPVTRNEVANWLSTETTTVQAFDAVNNRTTVTNSGNRWLLNRIEIDPDVNAASWAVKGTLEVDVVTATRFFGDDREGLETKETQDRTYDMTYTWGGTEVGVKGSLTNRRASITPPDGATHAIEGDWDGTLDVTLGGTSFKISAEEWLTGVEP